MQTRAIKIYAALRVEKRAFLTILTIVYTKEGGSLWRAGIIDLLDENT